MFVYEPDFDYTGYIRPLGEPPFHFESKRHEIEVCTNLVWYHRYRYYILDDPEVSDAAYDRLERRLMDLTRRKMPHDSPLRTVGSSHPFSYPANIRAFFMGGRPVDEGNLTRPGRTRPAN